MRVHLEHIQWTPLNPNASRLLTNQWIVSELEQNHSVFHFKVSFRQYRVCDQDYLVVFPIFCFYSLVASCFELSILIVVPLSSLVGVCLVFRNGTRSLSPRMLCYNTMNQWHVGNDTDEGFVCEPTHFVQWTIVSRVTITWLTWVTCVGNSLVIWKWKEFGSMTASFLWWSVECYHQYWCLHA